MNDKEKLRELIDSFDVKCAPIYGFRHYLADHLIANGVVVREKGEWVLGHVEPGYCTPGGNRPWICPKCGSVISWRLDKPTENFCPNCGADMTGGCRSV